MQRRSFLACSVGGLLAAFVIPGSRAQAQEIHQVIRQSDPEYGWFGKWLDGVFSYADCVHVGGRRTTCGYFYAGDAGVRVLSDAPEWVLQKYPKVPIQCNEENRGGPADYWER